MSGWDKREGMLDEEILDANEFGKVFSSLYSLNNKYRTTYKFAFIYCLLDSIIEVDEEQEISFEKLMILFPQIYWNLVNCYKLKQTNSTVIGLVEKGIINYVQDNPNLQQKFYVDIKIELSNLGSDIIDIACRNAIGAVYEDSKGKIFGFSKRNSKIYLSKASYKYIKENQKDLKLQNINHWSLYISKLNSSYEFNTIRDMLILSTMK